MAVYVGSTKLSEGQAKAYKKARSEGKSTISALKEAQKPRKTAGSIGLTGEDINKLIKKKGNITDEDIKKAAKHKIPKSSKITAGSIGLTGEDIFKLTQKKDKITSKDIYETAVSKEVKRLTKQGFPARYARRITTGQETAPGGYYLVDGEVAIGKRTAEALAYSKAQEKADKETRVSTYTAAMPSMRVSSALYDKASEFEISQTRSKIKGEFGKATGYGLASAATAFSAEVVGIGETVYDFSRMTGPSPDAALRRGQFVSEFKEGISTEFKRFQEEVKRGSPLAIGKIATLIAPELALRSLGTRGAFTASKADKAGSIADDLLITEKGKRTARFPAAERTAQEIEIARSQRTLNSKFKEYQPKIVEIPKSSLILRKTRVVEKGKYVDLTDIKIKKPGKFTSTTPSDVLESGQRLKDQGRRLESGNFWRDKRGSAGRGTKLKLKPQELLPSKLLDDIKKPTSRIIGKPISKISRLSGLGYGVGSLSILGARSTQLTGQAQTPGFKPADITKIGTSSILRPAQAQISAADTKPITITSLFTGGVVATASTAYIFSPKSPSRPRRSKSFRFVPDFDFDIGGGQQDGFGFRRKGRRQTKYTPSVIAQTFEIYGAKPKGILSGLEFRPLIK